jgi:hypothetical protein
MNDELTIWVVFGGIIAAAAVFVYWLKFMINRQNRNAAIYAIKQGQGIFLTWHYSPEDWKLAAEEHFQIKPRRLSENGKASFTEKHVFITNGTDELLYELIGGDRYVKHLTDVYLYKQAAQNVIRFEVRTKTIKKDEYGNDTMEEDYGVERFYVPVPKAAAAEGEKVLKFYKDILDRNADAVAAVMPFGLGIFKK